MSGVYTGIVQAANPVGLLPNLDSFLNQSSSCSTVSLQPVRRPSRTSRLPGYQGQKLTFEVPDGWTDWMAAIQIISQELEPRRYQGQPHLPVGQCPHFGPGQRHLRHGDKQQRRAGSDPWSYFDHVYQLPIGGAGERRSCWPQHRAVQRPGCLEASGASQHHSSSDTGDPAQHLQHSWRRTSCRNCPNPAVVQRRLVPGQRHVLEGLPVEHGLHRPKRAGHVGRLPGGHDHGLRAGRSRSP